MKVLYNYHKLTQSSGDFKKVPKELAADGDDKNEIADILPHIDTLIDRMESNKQVLAKKIFTIRKSIQNESFLNDPFLQNQIEINQLQMNK